ncbi:MAG: DUF4123 domain-containing protein [Candidatus Desantisbacteria bacterium]
MLIKTVCKSLGNTQESYINTKTVDEEGELEELLFQFAKKDGGQLFAILDAARSDEVLARLIQSETEYESLFKGRKEEGLYDVAPFLVVCKEKTELMQWLTSEGWGESLGVFFSSPDSFKNLLCHFQNLLIVKGSDGDEMYFRFYDPRVLRAYLPTCTMQELNLFFGNINRFMVESKDSKLILSFDLTN